MNSTEEHVNPVAQLIELCTQPSEDPEPCREFFTKNIERLSGPDVRRLLLSQDDTFLRVLREIQPDDYPPHFSPVFFFGWTVLFQACGLFDRGDPSIDPQGRRLFYKLLLRHADLLCSSATKPFDAFIMLCRDSAGHSLHGFELERLFLVANHAFKVISVSTTLLLETCRESPYVPWPA